MMMNVLRGQGEDDDKGKILSFFAERMLIRKHEKHNRDGEYRKQ
jgi:hypothetical protein